jgi:hypothetical protein
MTSIFQEKQDNLNYSENGRQLNFSGNGRRPQIFRKRKMTSISENGRRPQFQEMEDDINFSGKGK